MSGGAEISMAGSIVPPPPPFPPGLSVNSNRINLGQEDTESGESNYRGLMVQTWKFGNLCKHYLNPYDEDWSELHNFHNSADSRIIIRAKPIVKGSFPN